MTPTAAIAEALKTNPSCLAAVLFAVLFAVHTYLSLVEKGREAHEGTIMPINECLPAPAKK